MNYYEYCKTISSEYYPKIYLDTKNHIKKVLNKIDKDKLHPFPNSYFFEELVCKVYESYKKEKYEKCLDGEVTEVDLTIRENVNLFKDLIKIILIDEIINQREKHKDYPLYF